jgi:hypothetical protein
VTDNDARTIVTLLLREAGETLVAQLQARLLATVTAADLEPARAQLVAALLKRVEGERVGTYEVDQAIKAHTLAVAHEVLGASRADVEARVAAEVQRRLDEVIARQVDDVINAELADVRARLAARLGTVDAKPR